MNLNQKWCITEGEQVDDLLRWANDAGGLVDVSGMTMEIRLAKLSNKTKLESHPLTSVSETVGTVQYQIGVKFTPTLPAGTYQTELVFQQGANPPIIQQGVNLVIQPRIK